MDGDQGWWKSEVTRSWEWKGGPLRQDAWQMPGDRRLSGEAGCHAGHTIPIPGQPSLWSPSHERSILCFHWLFPLGSWIAKTDLEDRASGFCFYLTSLKKSTRQCFSGKCQFIQLGPSHAQDKQTEGRVLHNVHCWSPGVPFWALQTQKLVLVHHLESASKSG